MNDQYVEPIKAENCKYSLEYLKKSGKLTLIFAIISISLSVLFPIVCIATLAIAFLPFPGVGLVLSIIFTVFEILILLARMFFNIFALVRAIILLVQLSGVEQGIESKEIRTKAIISIVLCGLSWIICIAATPLMIFTNLVETVLSAF